MSGKYDEHKIATEFCRLRKVEQNLAPPFASLLTNRRGTKLRQFPLRPAAGLVFAVLILSVTGIILLNPGHKGTGPETVDDPQHFADAIQLGTDSEMPTDFLLNTPWSQLASLTLEPQLLDLPFEYLEELPNEL